MPKDDRVYVAHMLDTARRATGKLAGRTRDDFDADDNLRLALAYLLQIIGEAARSVSVSFQHANPKIPWKAIIGMRHRVVHDYMNVDEDMLWETVVSDLPSLIAELEKIVAE